MKPSTLLRAVLSLVETVFGWATENDFVSCAAGDPDANEAVSLREVKRSFKKVIRLLRKKDIDPASKRIVQRLCQRIKRIECCIVVFPGSASFPPQLLNFVHVIEEHVFSLESLYRVTPAELHGTTGVSSTDRFCKVEIENTGALTGMMHNPAYQGGQQAWTQYHFGVFGMLRLTEHVVWRTSYRVGNRTIFLHTDDQYAYEINEYEYHKPGQAILPIPTRR